jgi:hypothetical protein
MVQIIVTESPTQVSKARNPLQEKGNDTTDSGGTEGDTHGVGSAGSEGWRWAGSTGT